MGIESFYHLSLNNRISPNAGNSKGISLLFIIFLMLILSMAVISFLTFGVKLRNVEKDRITSERMETVREALQRYYLANHNLPAPVNIDESKTIPTLSLNLPQKYRYDSSGEFIHYDWRPLENDPDKIDIRGLSVRETSVAAVLVAPGPDKQISDSNLETPYADPNAPASDDIIVAISLNAEAIKIATRAVGILQAAAKAYDYQIYRSTNDGNTDYLPPPFLPRLVIREEYDPDDPPESIEVTYISETRSNRNKDIAPTSAVGGNGVGCVRYGRLDNDPFRGIYSLDFCPAGQAAQDIVDVYGLNVRNKTDPWGEFYQWGNSGVYVDTDRRYWNFFSMGPDKTPGTNDDITPTADIIETDLDSINVPEVFLQSTITRNEPIPIE